MAQILGKAAAGVGVVADVAFRGGEDAFHRIVGDREGFDKPPIGTVRLVDVHGIARTRAADADAGPSGTDEVEACAIRIVVVRRVTHRSSSSCRRPVCVIVVSRVPRPVGSSPRRAICALVLRPLRSYHVRTNDNGNGHHDFDCCILLLFVFLLSKVMDSRNSAQSSTN